MAVDPRQDPMRRNEISSLYLEQHTIQNLRLYISGILHLIFLDHSCPQVTETAESETTDKGVLL